MREDSRPAAHDTLMAKLSAGLDVLGHAVPPGSKVVYLHYPPRFHVGDLLIDSGTEAFFQRMRYEVLARLSLFDLCRIFGGNAQTVTLKSQIRDFIDSLDPTAILVLHGGGNSGEGLAEMQAVRERVALDFPARRIVVLPQTLHFRDRKLQMRSLENLVSHRDMHLFCRDWESLAAILDVSPRHGALSPDMAHALWSRREYSGAAQPGCGSLVLKQGESAAFAEDTGLGHFGRTDWPGLVSGWDNLRFQVLRKTGYVDLDRASTLPVWYWGRLRDHVVRRAKTLVSRHETIITDCLHGLILASLLSKRTVLQDHPCGEVSRYVEAWLAGSPLICHENKR
jgi:pyruvyl transferase EpsO